MNLTTRILAAICIITASACQPKSEEHHHHEAGHDMAGDGPHDALYNEVMDIHDEVMPKMNDLHKAKQALQTKLELPGLAVNEKQDIDRKIARIDSASEGMMVWMRQFKPVADSVSEDSARAYLQNELEKVKKVREDILQTLESTQ